jgi:hypothetical protein
MIFAQSSTDSTVLNFNFRQCNNVGSAVYFTMPLRVSISGCTCQDYNVGGTNAERGGGRFVIFNAPATHWYVGENETILLAAPETGVDQNTGEQILLEAPQGLDSYDVVSATANTVTVSAGFDGYTNWHVFIVGGKGVGQFARILSRSGATYTLDRNFVVIPDATSRVNIVASAIDGAIYNNTLQGNSNFNGASSAFSTFVGGGGIVFDGNNCSLFNYGTMLWSPDAAILAGPCSCPLFFSEHRNNTFTGCNYGHRMVAVGPSDGETYTFLGVTYRDDVYTGCVAVDLYLNMQDDLALDLTAFDHCSWTDAPKGIYAPVASTLGQLVLYASSFALGTGTFSGSIASAPNGVTLTNSGTTFTGFQS